MFFHRNAMQFCEKTFVTDEVLPLLRGNSALRAHLTRPLRGHPPQRGGLINNNLSYQQHKKKEPAGWQAPSRYLRVANCGENQIFFTASP